ncbi:hypothetical protein GGI35DRAFT_397535 [Trichoderma velutinum]
MSTSSKLQLLLSITSTPLSTSKPCKLFGPHNTPNLPINRDVGASFCVPPRRSLAMPGLVCPTLCFARWSCVILISGIGDVFKHESIS